MQKTLLSVTLVLFGVLTAVALQQHGYMGILTPHFVSTAGGQVLADLVIALTLVLFWLVRDAKRTGRNALPWVALTLVAGSFGPLVYLLTKKGETRSVAR
jgi:Terpene cyclase DEP1